MMFRFYQKMNKKISKVKVITQSKLVGANLFKLRLKSTYVTHVHNFKKQIMKKNILNLKEVKQLSITEQKAINGGKAPKCCIDWNPILRVCNEWDNNCLAG